MSIFFDDEKKQFVLKTISTCYMMGVTELGHLLHYYYGPAIDQEDESYLFRYYDHGFSGNPIEKRMDRTYTLDRMSQEYPSAGVGDYRISGIAPENGDGSRLAEFRYTSHEIMDSIYTIPGLPCAMPDNTPSEHADNGDTIHTLVIRLSDAVTGLKAELYYGVFEEKDIITRSVRLINEGNDTMYLDKASSACLDLPFGKWDVIHFHGRHCMERQPERIPVFHGVQSFGSDRGMSSHHQNPFIILCDRDATEDKGCCYGMMLVYSGNHKTEIETDQFDSTRIVMGINNENFRWKLDPGASFDTPQVLLTCADGLTKLSHCYHRFIRDNIIRSKLGKAHRPILVNSWEASYFDFDEESIISLATSAADLGMEMLVLDDGWFTNRNDDNSGLGDWVVDRLKLPNGLDGLIEKVTSLGLKFGLWIEPEMVNEDSDLYRTHPDFALKAPDRSPMMARNQMVLDLSREDVYEHVLNSVSSLLEKYDISYIKWDFNRPISDVYSHGLPPDRQGEVLHRYYLNLYRVYDELTRRFPDVLFEGCAGGGGRFDAGMLQYSPQIWCSDNTDPISRLYIQYGTSFGYPISATVAHVSASPNHQTGRTTPLETRAAVAMSGVYGYELDPATLSDEEKETVKKLNKKYNEIESIMHNGLYYRLTSLSDADRFFAWQTVDEHKEKSILTVVTTSPLANAAPLNVKLKGLEKDAKYSVDDEFICSGSALMESGYTIERMTGDYPAKQIFIRKI